MKEDKVTSKHPENGFRLMNGDSSSFDNVARIKDTVREIRRKLNPSN